MIVPGGDAPIFTGIRVVEWATHIAGPTVYIDENCVNENMDEL